ncbi:MAG TPA: site-specific integrase [Methylomirabilota bacterium]|nr:site-specific integrase [Methylomirabilota bacterium]HLF08839.1 site-specific integrase [Dehalococcoidia bacterium]
MGTRRRNGEGSLGQRSDGRWEGRLVINGRRRSFFGKSEREVLDKLTDAKTARKANVPIPSEKLTVAAFLTQYLEEVARPGLRPRSFERYEGIVRLHILPSVGKLRLARLTPIDLQALYNAKRKELSERSAQHIHAVVRHALNVALKMGLTSRNVAQLVPAPPSYKPPKIRPLTTAQMRLFLDAVSGDRLEAMYLVVISTGLRMGEVIGLRWSELDWDARALRVSAALQWINGKLTLVPPKSDSSNRTVALPDSLIAALRAHRARQAQERLLLGHDNELNLVFTSTVGTPLNPQNVRRRFQLLLERADLPRQRFHDLRHFHASYLLARSVPARVVMDRLGHSQIKLTLETYSHVAAELQREAADSMDALLVG